MGIASSLVKNINTERLPEIYKALVDKIGIEGTLKVAEVLGGQWLYFPNANSAIKDIRNERIRSEFNGYNYNELARKYGLSHQWIRKIVKKE